MKLTMWDLAGVHLVVGNHTRMSLCSTFHNPGRIPHSAEQQGDQEDPTVVAILCYVI